MDIDTNTLWNDTRRGLKEVDAKMTDNFDRIIITLSAGSFVFTLSLLSSSRMPRQPVLMILCQASIILFVICIVISLTLTLARRNQARKHLSVIDEIAINGPTATIDSTEFEQSVKTSDRLHSIVTICFVVALILLTIFAMTNLS